MPSLNDSYHVVQVANLVIINAPGLLGIHCPNSTYTNLRPHLTVFPVTARLSCFNI